MIPTSFFRKVKTSSEHLFGESNNVRGVLQLPVLVCPPAARHCHPGLDFIANEGNVLLHKKFRVVMGKRCAGIYPIMAFNCPGTLQGGYKIGGPWIWFGKLCFKKPVQFSVGKISLLDCSWFTQIINVFTQTAIKN